MKYHDHFGRPLVAITGAGVVTSLGQGKHENWQKLTNGVSGIHKITRFPVEGLNTYIAGTIDFLKESTLGASALSEKLAHLSAEEALEQAALNKTNFNGPLFLAAPPVELEWQARFNLDQEEELNNEPSYAHLLRICRHKRHEALLKPHNLVPLQKSCKNVWHKGAACYTFHGLCIWCDSNSIRR